MLISPKKSISTEDEIVIDTTLSKVLNFLGVLLIMSGIVLFLIILGRNEADLLNTKQTVMLCTAIVVCIGVGAWFELKSQRHQKRKTLPEYIHDDYDRLQDEEEEDDYDYLQDGEEDA